MKNRVGVTRGNSQGAVQPAPPASAPASNADIAALLNKLADLAEIAGDDVYRARAYRRAARAVETISPSIADRLARGEDLSELRWIGKRLARKLSLLERTAAPIRLKLR